MNPQQSMPTILTGSVYLFTCNKVVKILIQADNGTIVSNYVKNVYKSTVTKDSGDKVCKWCFGKDHVIFRLKESGECMFQVIKLNW